MKANPAPIFVPPLEPGSAGVTTPRISSSQTDGAYCVCEMSTIPGDGVSLHIHDRDEEFYYIIEGAYEFEAGGESFRAEAGALVVIPRDVPHKFRNAGDVPARALMIFRPGGFDDLLTEMRTAATAHAVGEQERREILGKWGITFLKEKSKSE